MKIFKIGCYLFLYFTISACSNTAHVNIGPDNNHYYTKDFNHTEFTIYHKDSVKKRASTDQELMLSLINRAMPEDQRMMLAFAKSQEHYLPENAIVGIQIKGNKHEETTKHRVISNYAQMINQDINAVNISAMPK
jgi:hypothetical protein